VPKATPEAPILARWLLLFTLKPRYLPNSPLSHGTFWQLLAPYNALSALAAFSKVHAPPVVTPNFRLALCSKNGHGLKSKPAFSTHAQRWKYAHDAVGHGHLYQGRFKSFPIQDDGHLLIALRYVERNPLRAKLVERAEEWRWGSCFARQHVRSRSSTVASA